MKISLNNKFISKKHTSTSNGEYDIITPIYTFTNVINSFEQSNIINNQNDSRELIISITSLSVFDEFLLKLNQFVQNKNNINQESKFYSFLTKAKLPFTQISLANNYFQPARNDSVKNIDINITQNPNLYKNHDLYKLVNAIGIEQALNLVLLHEIGHILNRTNKNKQNQEFFYQYLDEDKVDIKDKKTRFNLAYKNYSETYSDLYSILSLNLIDNENDYTSLLNNLISLRENYSNTTTSIQYDSFYALKNVAQKGLSHFKNISNFEQLNQIINQYCIDNTTTLINQVKNGYKTQSNKDISSLEIQFILPLKNNTLNNTNSINSNQNSTMMENFSQKRLTYLEQLDKNNSSKQLKI